MGVVGADDVLGGVKPGVERSSGLNVSIFIPESDRTSYERQYGFGQAYDLALRTL